MTHNQVWIQQSKGKLDWKNKLKLLRQLVVAQIQLSLKIGVVVNDVPFDLDNVRIPDSAIARQAMELCEDVSSSPIHLHCLRTYYWGSILGQQDKLKFDEELFFVMAQLHDLGLTDTYHGQDTSLHCFAVDGGQIAHKFCAEHGWSADRAAEVNRAIALHLNVDVPTTDGVEAHLLRSGSGMDVIGARQEEVAAATRRAVIEQYPRDGFATDLDTRMRREKDLRPQSRTAFLYTFAQFGHRIKSAKL